MSEQDVPLTSPCVSQCCLDDDDICMGCFRTLEEITGWRVMDDEQKKQVYRNIASRQQDDDCCQQHTSD